MTNQASEDELREQLADKLEWYSRYRERGQDDDMDRAFDGILALIRTEKLKLLKEVRERVIGENQHSEHKEWDCPCGVTHSFTEEWHATNRLRDEQRTALNKLEAEL